MNPRQRRAILLIALACIGLVGVFALIAGYVSDINKQVGPKERVLELTHDVPANQAIADSDVRDMIVPQKWAPKAALTDRSQLVGYVAAADLSARSVLQEGMITSPPHLTAGEREESVLVDASTGVAGEITPGRFVDVIAAYPADQQGDPPRPARTEVVVPSARVLKVGQPQIKGGNGVQDAQRDPTQVVPVTFALTKRQEILVAHAESFAADVRLALLPPGSPDPERTLGETIYRGEDPHKHKDGTIG
jgi:pilus assembly protein CpaB